MPSKAYWIRSITSRSRCRYRTSPAIARWRCPITLPQGVTQASLSSVSVSVTVGERTSTTFSDVQVRLINQEAEIDGMPITLDPRTVSVTVSGSEEMLQNITKEDIMVTADLKGITAAGERQLTLSVSRAEPPGGISAGYIRDHGHRERLMKG